MTKAKELTVLELTAEEHYALCEIIEFAATARAGNYLHQPHKAKSKQIASLAKKLGLKVQDGKATKKTI